MSVSHHGVFSDGLLVVLESDQNARRRKLDLRRSRRHGAEQPIDDRQRHQRREQPGVQEGERTEAHGALALASELADIQR